MSRCATKFGSVHRANAGFTLIELLVVIGVIAALAAIVISGLTGTYKTTSLRSAQATVVNALALARSKAMSSGRDVLFLVNDNQVEVTRYRRMLAVVDKADNTRVYSVAYLPVGAYVVPYQAHFSAAMIQEGDSWTTVGGASLTSSALSNVISCAVEGGNTEAWESYPIYAEGTSNQQGIIVVATGRERSPADAAANGSPIVLVSPDQVRGVSVSFYGLARLINDRMGF